jgi:tetratricopeptide (TPR) repeat protein
MDKRNSRAAVGCEQSCHFPAPNTGKSNMPAGRAQRAAGSGGRDFDCQSKSAGLKSVHAAVQDGANLGAGGDAGDRDRLHGCAAMRPRSDSGFEQPEPAVSSDQSLEKRGDLYMARKFFKEASETYSKAIAAEPRNGLLYNKLGIAYHQLLNYNAAKKAYRKSIQFNPRYAPAINNLAAVEYAQKHYKDAIITYLKALKLTPADALARPQSIRAHRPDRQHRAAARREELGGI